MLITGNFEAHAKTLLSDITVAQRQSLVTEMRDSIEIVHTSEYSNFLRHLFPAFHKILSEGCAQFTEGPEQKIRNMLLEVLNRLPNTETLRPHVQSMLSLCMQLLERDNEENAVICLRIIFDLHKNFRPTLEREVQPFLDFVQRIYRGLQKTVQQVFSEKPTPPQLSQQAQLQQQQAHAAHAQTQAQGRSTHLGPQPQAGGALGQAAQAALAAKTHSAVPGKGQVATPAASTGTASLPGSTGLQPGQQTTAQHAGQLAAAVSAGAGTAAEPSTTMHQQASLPADSGGADSSSMAPRAQASGVLTKSTESFKVLTECPLIVMLLFQLYPRYIQSTIPSLIPLMVHTLALSLPSWAAQRSRLACADFMAAQVKTLSFLTYLLRAFAEIMRPYQESIPKCVINLLRNCPAESVSIRKDILIATRHILATDFRKGFFNQIDVLLDEKVLIGSTHPSSARSAHEALRPLACSTLADLVQHVRSELGMQHLSKVVYIFSCNIHDSTLPLSIQTTSVRLLLNLVENIFHKNEPEGRALLVRILHCLVAKFATLRVQIPKQFDIHLADIKAKKFLIDGGNAPSNAGAPPAAAANSLITPTSAPEPTTSSSNAASGTPDSKMQEACTVAKSEKQARTEPEKLEKAVSESPRDCKQLLKTMILGVKTVVWSVSNSRMAITQTQPASGSVPQKGMSESESALVAKLLKEGLQCCVIYSHDPDSSPQEEKEVLDYFAGVFTVLDVRNFSQVFSSQIDFLYERVTANTAMSTILQHFLANIGVSRSFAEILLGFLVGKLKDLGSADEPQTGVLLRLFKLVFGSITLFPENEPVLRPHLATIVVSSTRHASNAAQPSNYFSLLRALFKSIGGGKFEQLYKEFLPLLPALLHSLIAAHATAHQQHVKELLLELCLTLPARLSSLLPYLHLLMRPVLHALKCGAELVTLALRTLEFWIDHLHPDFLQPLMSPVIKHIILALTKHLKPSPHPFGPTALRILGKLGGRNRQLLHEREAIQVQEAFGWVDSFAFVLNAHAHESADHGTSSRPTLQLPLGCAISRALDTIKAPDVDKTGNLKHCFQLVRICLIRTAIAPSCKAGALHESMQVDDVEGAQLSVIIEDAQVDAGKSQEKREKESAMFLQLCLGAFIAASDQVVSGEARPFLEGLTRHVALLIAYAQQPLSVLPLVTSARIATRPRAFVDALILAIGTAYRPEQGAVATAMLSILLETVQIAETKGDTSVDLRHMLMTNIMHLAYTCDARSIASVTASIKLLSDNQTASWLIQFEPTLLSALLRLSADEGHSAALELLLSSISRCHDPEVSDVAPETAASTADELVHRLAVELSNSAIGVRESARKALEHMALLMKQPVGALLLKQRDTILLPLLARRLRALPVLTQIAHVEAMSYCLKQLGDKADPNAHKMQTAVEAQGEPKEPHTLGPHLLAFLEEALRIAEGDEMPVVRDRTKMLGMHVRGLSLEVRLRIVCIELLCNAMSLEGLKSQNGELRNQMIACFFKSLTVRWDEVVSVASEALSHVINTQKLQKELLQSSLRPILLNLADYRKLTVHLLQRLSRLLSLLSNFFNLTLAEKLLEHLGRWTDPEALSKAKAFKQDEEIKIPCAILNLFHLLPPGPSKFLDRLVTVTMKLEAGMPGSTAAGRLWSPYREAILPYMNLHAAKVVAYFLERIADSQHFRMLHSFVKSKDAEPIRRALADNAQMLLKHTFNCSPQPPAIGQPAADMRFQGIVLVHAIVKRMPDWLSHNPDVLHTLMAVWESPERKERFAHEETMALEQISESKLLIKCFLIYCRHHAAEGTLGKHQVGLLFTMLSIFSEHTLINYTFLKDFYLNEVSKSYPPAHKIACIRHFLFFFQQQSTPQEDKVQALQLILLPMLTSSFEKEESVLSAEIVSTIIARLLGGELLQQYDEALRIELLKLATLLIEHVADQLNEHRKELIKFAWNHLKSEDTQSKLCAYVNVCRFIQVYDTPPKIILQVYVALLRTFQPDARALVKQALDILMPALPRRLPAGEHKYPTWIKWTKKIIVEEGHSLPQLIHIWQLVVRHPALFFSSSAQFVPQMVNSLNRIGLSPNCSTDNRKLAVELAQLIICWELQRSTNQAAASAAVTTVSSATGTSDGQALKRSAPEGEGLETSDPKRVKVEEADSHRVKAETNTATIVPPKVEGASVGPAPSAAPAATPSVDEDFKPSAAIVEVLISFLIRVALIVGENKDAQGLSEQCVTLLDSGLSVWPDANIKLQHFDKQISSSQDPLNALLAGIAVLRSILKRQPQFLLRNLKQLQHLLRPAFETHLDDSRMLDALCSFLSHAIPALTSTCATDPNAQGFTAELSQLVQWVSDMISAGLQMSKEAHVYGAAMLLQVLTQHRPESLDFHMSALVKLLQRQSKEHAIKESQKSQSASTATTPDDSLRLQTLKLVIKLMSGKDIDASEQRKVAQISMMALVERSSDADLLKQVSQVISRWVTAPFTSPNALTAKDRAAFVLKMACFESIPSPELHTAYLKMVHQLHVDPNLNRPELLERIEPAFMFGLRSRNAELRNAFFELLHKAVGRSLSQRLSYIISTQDWDPLSNTLWLRQAVQLLLASADPQQPLIMPPSSLQLPTLRLSSNREDLKPCNPALDGLLAEHQKFINECQQPGTFGELMGPLSELLHDHGSPTLAVSLWVSLFPQVWSQFQQSEQEGLVKPIIAILSKEHNLRQQTKQPNVVQGWLQALAACRPLPKLPAALLKFLAKSFNAWPVVIPLLQQQGLYYPTEPQWYDALSELFTLLGDRDAVCALWAKRAANVDTRLALALEQYSAWHAAQASYVECMRRWQDGDVALVNTPRPELALWEAGLVRSAKNLNQWELLTEFAKALPTAQPELLMECSWKIGDWERLKDLFHQYSLPDLPSVKMLQTYSAIKEGKLPEAEQRCNEGIQFALQQWCALPPLEATTHTPLLQIFQQFQELHESAQMLLEISNAQRQSTTPDLSSILTTWRERLPNAWEDLPAWNDLVSWRNHMFSHINNVLGRVPDGRNASAASIGFQEMLWTVIRFAHVARRQSLPEACINIIAKIQAVNANVPQTDITDNYNKLREQARSCLQLPGYAPQGLQLLNQVDIEYLSAAQKSEFYQIKAELLLTAASANPEIFENSTVLLCTDDDLSNASGALAISLSLHGAQPRAWLLWGAVCEAKSRRSGDFEWADRALSCYLQAATHKLERVPGALPRVFAILRDSTPDARCKLAATFGKYCDGVPLWGWLPWLPQLLAALPCAEGPQVQHLLLRCVKSYPQAIYYPLRTYMANSKSKNLQPPPLWAPEALPTPTPVAGLSKQLSSAGSTSESAPITGALSVTSDPSALIRADCQTVELPMVTPNISTDSIGADAAGTFGSACLSTAAAGKADSTPKNESEADHPLEKHMEAGEHGDCDEGTPTGGAAARVLVSLEKELPQLMAQMSLVADSITTKLLPSCVENLLESVCDLLKLCLSIPVGAPDPPPSEVQQSFHTVLASMQASSPYQADFKRDFCDEQPRRVGDLIARLEVWRTRLEPLVLTDHLSRRRLEDSCWRLMSWTHPLIEVPGQYVGSRGGSEPALDQHVFVDRFAPDVDTKLSLSTGRVERTVSVWGDDCKLYSFALRFDSPLRPHEGLWLERFSQLASMLNKRFLKSREARRRSLMLHAVPSIRLGQGVSLVPTEPGAVRTSLEHVLFVSRMDAGVKPNEPLLHFQRAIGRGGTNEDQLSRQARLREAYNDACSAVPEDILTQAMHLAMPSPFELWALQRRLASQLGLHALLCHSLKLRATSPSSIILRQDHAAIELSQFDLPLQSTSAAAVGTMPFRLTRNLLHFITPLGVDGAFSGSFSAAAECMAQHRKSPLVAWLDILSRAEDPTDEEPSGGDVMEVDGTSKSDLRGLVPWGAEPVEALSVVADLSPELAVQRKTEYSKTMVSGKGNTADVHAGLRVLIEEATDIDKLQAMPPAWQPWL